MSESKPKENNVYRAPIFIPQFFNRFSRKISPVPKEKRQEPKKKDGKK